MSLLKRLLHHVLTDNRYTTLERSQIEAFADTLALAMTVDRHIAVQEREAITATLKQFELGDATLGEHVVNLSVHRAWDVVGADETRAWEFCRELYGRLGIEWLRENAYEASVRIVHADGKLEDAEGLFLEQLAEGLRLDDEIVTMIHERADRAHAEE
ncbi:MAG: TerB family tellurite resistance protein [Myxococcota bacterium]